MRYQVVVPSYRRPGILAERTLPALLNGGVPAGQVTVFVHTHDPQLADYQHLADKLGINLVATSVRGIIPQRRLIANHFPPGTPVVTCDDDVRSFKQPNGTKLETIKDVDALFAAMFQECHNRGLFVWGLYPSLNAFYMSPNKMSEGLRFLVFTCIGFITRPGHPVHDNTVSDKDDYEFSLRAWWFDGATLRNDGVAAEADIRKLPGGCDAAGRNVRAVEESVASLMMQWPKLIRRNNRRNTGHPEILLTPKGRHSGNPPHRLPPGLTP